jgi:hypothetical protein
MIDHNTFIALANADPTHVARIETPSSVFYLLIFYIWLSQDYKIEFFDDGENVTATINGEPIIKVDIQ